MKEINVTGTKRTDVGKKAAKLMRKEGLIPCNLYGEKKDKNGDGSYVVIGSEQGLKANADGIFRNEYENGGCVVATMSTVENFFEVTLFDTDYATTKAAFEALIAVAY